MRARACSKRAKCASIPTGGVTVFTGSHSHGQGHETTFAQIVAAQARHRHRHGRSRARRHRSRPVRHGHLRLALACGGRHRDREGARQGDREGQEDRGAPARGGGRRTSSSRTASSRSPAPTAARPSRRSRSPRTCRTTIRSTRWSPASTRPRSTIPTNFTYPAGTHICEVEVDPDTGKTTVVSFTACDDFGNIINPMIVEGQVHGGVAQGLGPGAARELRVRQQSGQLLSGSYMDYAMPRCGRRADDQGRAPRSRRARTIRSASKGCGEAERHRRARGDDERGARRAAGRAASRTSRCPHRRTACGKRSSRPRSAKGDCDMYSFELKKADSVANAAALLAQTNGKLARRRPEPRRRDEASPGAAGHAGRPVGHRAS